MNNFALVFSIFLLASPLVAGEYKDARDEAYGDAVVISTISGVVGDNVRSPCAIVGVRTANIIIERLNGVAMSAQMAAAEFSFYRFVVQDAYGQPFFRGLEMQEQLVRDFREKYELECYDVLGVNG